MSSITPIHTIRYYQQIGDFLEQRDYRGAIRALLLRFAQIKTEELGRLYPLLLELFPHFTIEEYQLIEKHLPVLLQNSFHLYAEQRELARQLAKRALAYPRSDSMQDLTAAQCEAMSYFAKALQIIEAELKRGKTETLLSAKEELHKEASALFVAYAKNLLMRDGFYENNLERARLAGAEGVEYFGQLIAQIGALKRFCLNEEDHQSLILPLYNNAGNILNRTAIPGINVQRRYDAFFPIVEEGMVSRFAPTFYTTEKYSQALKHFKDAFDLSLEVSKLQQTSFAAFQQLFKLLLDDALAIVGPTPCHYDIRAMGSCARQELCPYSDLELLILIEDEAQVPYFRKLVQMLEFQILSLGETATPTLVFTAIHQTNPSGFHIDESPAIEGSHFLHSPQKMAQLQNREVPPRIQYTALKSRSLAQSSPQLYRDYRDALQKCHPIQQRQKQALALFKERLADYNKQWKQPFNLNSGIIDLKKDFLEPIFYLLADLALYLGVDELNTLELIPAFFTESSRKLLRETICHIYTTRLRLHLKYHQQKEEAQYGNVAQAQIEPLSAKEVSVLERAYWLVLRPLYSWIEKPVFDQVDLIRIAFDSSLVGLKSVEHKRLISHIAAHLTQCNRGFEVHQSFYQELSQRLETDALRSAYLIAMEENGASEELVEALSLIPTRSGLRQFMERRNLKLRQILQKEITTADPPEGEIIVKVSCPFFDKPRYLKPGVVKLDALGNIEAFYANTAHSVAPAWGGRLHFKQKPTHPLMEYAIHNLTSRLAGFLTPSTELLRFEVKGNMYPVLVSETIPGITLRDALKLKPVLDRTQWTWLLLCAILTRPGDGRLSNYIADTADKNRIYCIDNDYSFVEPVVKGSLFQDQKVHFHSTLFCLDNMQLDREVLRTFCTLDIELILQEWMDDVIKKESEYLNLFSEQERSELYRQKPNEGFTPTILFRPGALATLNMQFWQLQTYLTANPYADLTPGHLLKQLIRITEDFTVVPIGGHVDAAYRNRRAETLSQSLRLGMSMHPEESMTSSQYHQAALGKVPTAGEIEKKEFSPAEAIKEFFQKHIGKDFTRAEIENKKELLSKDFPLLQRTPARQAWVLAAMAHCVHKKVIKIILLNCLILDATRLNPFLHAHLLQLDIRYCPEIGNTAIRAIHDTCKALKELHISHTPRLTAFNSRLNAIHNRFLNTRLEFPALEVLSLSHCSNLEQMTLTALNLKVLKVTHADKLKEVDFEAPALVECDFRSLPQAVFTPSAKQAILAAIQSNGEALKYLPTSITDSEEFLLAAVEKNAAAFGFAFDHIDKKGRKEITNWAEHDAYYPVFSRLRTFTELAVRKNWRVLPHTRSIEAYDGEHTERYNARSDELLLHAIGQDVEAYQYVAESIKNNDFHIRAIKYNPRLLSLVYDSLSPSTLLRAVVDNPQTLLYFPKKKRIDADFILKVVKEKAEAIAYVPQAFKQRREFLLRVIEQNGEAFAYIPERIRQDKNFVLAAALKKRDILHYLPINLKQDRQLLLDIVCEDPKALRYCPSYLRSDKPFVISAIERNPYLFSYIDQSLQNEVEPLYIQKMRNFKKAASKEANRFSEKSSWYDSKTELLQNYTDKALVIEYLRKEGLHLQFFEDIFKKDREVVLAAVQQDGEALEFAADDLKNDPEIVFEAVQNSGASLRFAAALLRSDPRIVVAAVSQCGFALKFASENLRKNKGLVLKAVTQFGLALEFASKELQWDREVVLAAVKQNGLARRFVTLYDYEEIELAAVKQNGLALAICSRRDRELVLAAVKQNSDALNLANATLKNDAELLHVAVHHSGFLIENVRLGDDKKGYKTLALAAVRQDPKVFQRLSSEFKEDRDIALAAAWGGANVLGGKNILDKEIVLATIKHTGLALKFASNDLQSDLEVVFRAVSQNGLALRFASKELQANREIVLAAVNNTGGALEYADLKLRGDKTIVLSAIKDSATTLKFASDALKADKEIVLAAVRQIPEMVKIASPELQTHPEILLVVKEGLLKRSSLSQLDLKSMIKPLKTDPQIITVALTYSPLNFVEVPNELLQIPMVQKAVRRAIILAIEQKIYHYKDLADQFKNDQEILLAAIKLDITAFGFALTALKNEHAFVLTAVKQNGLILQFVSDDLKSNREIVLAAVSSDGMALKYASDDLLIDQEIVALALKNNLQFDTLVKGNMVWFEKMMQKAEIRELIEWHLFELSKFDLGAFPYQNNVKKYVLAAVKYNGRLLRYAGPLMREDREVVMQAVKQDGWALASAAEAFKSDRTVVLEAVKQNGLALKESSDDLKADRPIVLAAVNQNGNALEYASKELRKDKEIVVAAIKQTGDALQYADELYKNDREVGLLALQKMSRFSYEEFSEILKRSREFTVVAVAQKGEFFKFATYFQEDEEIALIAIQQDAAAFHFCTSHLKQNGDFILKALQKNGLVLQCTSPSCQADKAMVLAAVQQNGDALRFASEELRDDKAIILAAVRQKGTALQYASEHRRYNTEIILAALQQNPEAWNYVPRLLREDKQLITKVPFL